MNYLTALFAGLFLCNCIPHLVCGLKGEPFPTPFSKPPGVGDSSPLTNFLWGAANLILGAGLINWHPIEIGFTPQCLVLVIAFVLCGAWTACHFGNVRAGKMKKPL